MFTARAAMNGHVPSLIEFVNAPDNAAGEFLRSPALSGIYRHQLWPLLQRAFAEGRVDVATMVMMQLASSNSGSALSVVVPMQFQDPETALALLHVLHADVHPDSSGMPIFDNKPPAEHALVTAQQWAEQLFGELLPTQEAGGSPTRAGSSCHERADWLGQHGRSG
jgi:hypothetical protein